MRLAVAVVAGLAFSVVTPAITEAQVCMGSASFGAGIARIGASASFSDGTKLYGGELALGAPRGLFGTADAAQTTTEGESATSTVIGGTLGYSLEVGSITDFCAIAAFSHITFPDLQFGSATITSSQNNVGFGGALGVSAVVSPDLSVVPYTSVQYVHATATASSASVGSQSASQDYGVLEIGFGLVMGKIVSLRPSVSIPVGLTGGKTAVNIGLAVNFGHVER